MQRGPSRIFSKCWSHLHQNDFENISSHLLALLDACIPFQIGPKNPEQYAFSYSEKEKDDLVVTALEWAQERQLLSRNVKPNHLHSNMSQNWGCQYFPNFYVVTIGGYGEEWTDTVVLPSRQWRFVLYLSGVRQYRARPSGRCWNNKSLRILYRSMYIIKVLV